MPNSASQTAHHHQPDRLRNLFCKLPAMEQALADHHSTLPVKFKFSWAGVDFKAVAEMIDDDRIKLRLSGDLGIVPYSGEAPAIRRRLMDLIGWRDHMSGFTYVLTPGCHLELSFERDVTIPSSRTGLLAVTAHTLVEARPYLELAGEVRLGLASDGGSMRT